jgi:hypothetical protein
MTAPSTNPCGECGGTGWKVVTGVGAGTAQPCVCRVRSLPDKLLACGVWPRYLNCTRDTWQGIWPEEHISRFGTDFSMLTILGPTGVGKSHLGVAILAEAVGRNEPGIWRDGRATIEAIKAGFDTAEGTGELERLKAPCLLVLDDLGQELAGEWSGGTLSHILRFRDGHLYSTIITSNISSLEVVDGLEPRLASRLAPGVLRLQGSDWRLKTVGTPQRRDPAPGGGSE